MYHGTVILFLVSHLVIRFILTIFNNMICLFVDEKNTTFYSVIFHIG